MSFTPSILETIKRDIHEALTAVAAKHKVTFGWERGSYDTSGHATLKLTLTEDNAPSKDRTNYETYAPMEGLPADTFGKQFVAFGETFEITGFNPKAREIPIIAKMVKSSTPRSTKVGKLFKFRVEQVQRGLGITPTFQSIIAGDYIVSAPPRS